MKLKNVIRKIEDNNDGVSLIELLVSILLLSIIVVAFLSAFEVSTRNNITSGEKVNEGYIAQTYMEDLISIAAKDSVTTVGNFINEIEASYSISSVNEGTNKVFSIIEGAYVVRITIKEKEDSIDPSDPSKNIKYTNILVDVYESPYTPTSNSLAKLQNIIKIK